MYYLEHKLKEFRHRRALMSSKSDYPNIKKSGRGIYIVSCCECSKVLGFNAWYDSDGTIPYCFDCGKEEYKSW